MLKVVCVYRSGGDFDSGYVAQLKTGVEKYLEVPHEFICLTDRRTEIAALPGVAVMPLRRPWPGWWSKMELFSLPGPLLFFDLDTVIVGDISPLAAVVSCLAPNEILMLRGFYKGDHCSGIMGFNAGLGWLFRDFCHLSGQKASFQSRDFGFRLSSARGVYRGDQDYIAEAIAHKGMRVVLAQDVSAGIRSYKVDIRPGGKVPEGCRVICFHGKPRPHEVNLEELWRE